MVTAKDIVLLSGALVLSACAPATQPPLPVNHPGNPAASEAPATGPSATLKNEPLDRMSADESEARVAGHMHGHQHGHSDAANDSKDKAAAKGEYRCPMHPDVRSDEPGRCPKCGMNLQREGGEQ
jgi:hypothetical protein